MASIERVNNGTRPSMDSRIDRAIALAVDMVAFYTRTAAWLLLIWVPLAGVFILLFSSHDEVKRIVGIGFLSAPLFGLLLMWISSGIFDLKLGRTIIVLLLSLGFVVLELLTVVFMARTKPQGMGGLFVGVFLYLVVAAVLGCGLIRRSHLLRSR